MALACCSPPCGAVGVWRSPAAPEVVCSPDLLGRHVLGAIPSEARGSWARLPLREEITSAPRQRLNRRLTLTLCCPARPSVAPSPGHGLSLTQQSSSGAGAGYGGAGKGEARSPECPSPWAQRVTQSCPMGGPGLSLLPSPEGQRPGRRGDASLPWGQWKWPCGGGWPAQRYPAMPGTRAGWCCHSR